MKHLALLPFLLSAHLTAPFRGDDEPELDYAALAREFLEEHDSSGGQPGAVSLAGFLDDAQRYRRFDLGAFDVRVACATLQDRAGAELFAHAARGLVRLQEHWYRWSAPEGLEAEAVLADFELLAKWVDSWSTSSLGTLGRNAGQDFLERLGASADQRAAHARIQKTMSTGEYLDIALSDEANTQILFVADRGAFLRLLCFTGWNAPDARAYYWKKGIEQWTTFWNEETQVVALQYPEYPVDMKHPERGSSMNEFEKTGVGQHAAEKGAASLFWRYFGNNDALFYEAALATNLALAIYGENNVRTGAPVYKNSGGSTSSFEVFVPGGNSAGGTLPGRRAVGVIEVPLWRETKGEDHYVEGLQKAQKLGQKLAKKAKDGRKDERIHFQITGPKPADKTYVSAPFFGVAAAAKELPPKDYLEDYEEFFRAYRASFFHWLATVSVGRDAGANAAKFAELNRRLATRAKDSNFDEIVSELYGVPLSAADGSTDSLEWRFLAWIAKGGR